MATPTLFDLDQQWSLIVIMTLAACFAGLIVAAVFTRLRQGSSHAWIRLDWFLPALRKRRPDVGESSGPVARLLRRWLPDWLQSNRDTKRRGPIRRYLRKFGISWQASPIRRLSQASFLLLFLFLFLVSCWPYSATPLRNETVLQGLQLVEIKEDTADLRFAIVSSAKTLTGRTLFLIPETSSNQASRISIPVRVTESKTAEITAECFVPPSDVQLDLLLSPHVRTWTLQTQDPFAWPSHHADNFRRKEFVPAELFLAIDPLVSISTAIASRSWVWSLACAGLILIVCVIIPRGFCGYLCPLGTTIDLFDWMIGRHVTRFRVSGEGWWVHIKYYLLAGTLISAVLGVLVSGFVAAIPIVTRAALMVLEPAQSGALRGWYSVPGMNLGHVVSLAMFVAVLALGFLRPRFWCKYVCPSGAVFSLGNLFRLSERKVESSCINCNKCVEICPFDAIKPDFTTRTSDCTLCQSCAGVCPTHAIKFVERNNVVELKVLNDPPTGETSIGRRGFLSLASGSALAVAGGVATAQAVKWNGPDLNRNDGALPVRPPGSVPEDKFLEMCISCGECFKVCPNNVLQVQGFEQGLAGLWTPVVRADWAGCDSSCNACGQACPTGAIRALPLDEKRHAHMGLAIVNESTCLPYAGRDDCDLCVQECDAAGYHAIEYQQVGTEVDASGKPIDGSGFLAPIVVAERCVGCGLCQTRCYGINVKSERVLSASAIIIEAGAGKEDRLMSGSYRELHSMDSPLAEPPKPQVRGLEATETQDFGENPFGI